MAKKEKEDKDRTKADVQAFRQSKYPEDRIALLPSAADLDKTVLYRWWKYDKWKENHKELKEKAMKEIAVNNCLEEVTEEQFDTLCRITGYW